MSWDPTKIDEYAASMDANTIANTFPVWTTNAFRNHPVIERRWAAGTMRDIREIPTARERGRKAALLLASGPSLHDADGLIGNWEGDIWCGATQLSWLGDQGVDPTYCMVVDANPRIGAYVDRARRNVATHYITHPFTNPALMRQPQVSLYRTIMPGVPVTESPTFEQAFGTLAGREGVVSKLVGGGNYVNVALAMMGAVCGYDPIYLVGYDLAYVDDMQRHDEPLTDKPTFHEAKAERVTDPQTGLETDMQKMLYAARCREVLEAYCKDVRVVNASRGLELGTPRVRAQDLLKPGSSHTKPAPYEMQ